ncbi:MAG: extracellular solute-binding protein [Rhizobiales bacterium]|nr:extracellular solute-binding protein [Hyphomicrobiales bacterium]
MKDRSILKGLDRRQVLAGLGAAATLPLMPRTALAADVKQITVTSYGGIWERAIRECFVTDFKARTGVDAEVLIGGPPQWISQIEANKDNPPIHVLVATPDSAAVAVKAGLVDPISVEKVPNLANVPQQFIDMALGHGAAFDYGAAGLAYNKDTVKNPPKSIKEFVERTIAGEWKAGLPTISYAPAPQAFVWSFADALGGGVENLDPFFAAMQKMRPNVVFWTGVTDFLNLMDAGEVDIGVYYDGRTWAHYDTGKTYIDFINPEEGGVMSPVCTMKVKNAPEIAWEYVNSMLAPGPQAEFAKILNYGVTNTQVQYDELRQKRITPWEKTRFPPNDRIGELLPAWTERWNKEIGA